MKLIAQRITWSLMGIKPRRSGPQCDKLLICTGSSRLTKLLLPKDQHDEGNSPFCPARCSLFSCLICQMPSVMRMTDGSVTFVVNQGVQRRASAPWQAAPLSRLGLHGRVPLFASNIQRFWTVPEYQPSQACMSTRSMIREAPEMAQCSLQTCFINTSRLLHAAYGAVSAAIACSCCSSYWLRSDLPQTRLFRGWPITLPTYPTWQLQVDRQRYRGRSIGRLCERARAETLRASKSG